MKSGMITAGARKVRRTRRRTRPFWHAPGTCGTDRRARDGEIPARAATTAIVVKGRFWRGLPDPGHPGPARIARRIKDLKLTSPRLLVRELAADPGDLLTVTQEELGGIAGALVEPKRLAVAVHYRQVAEADKQAVEDAVDRTLEAETELRKTYGKKVFELRPRLDWDKGKAVLWVLEALGLEGADDG